MYSSPQAPCTARDSLLHLDTAQVAYTSHYVVYVDDILPALAGTRHRVQLSTKSPPHRLATGRRFPRAACCRRQRMSAGRLTSDNA